MIKPGGKKHLHDSVFDSRNKLQRIAWIVGYQLFFRFSPKPFFSYRRWVLRLFGAAVGDGVNVHSSVKIWLPSNLQLSEGATLGPNVTIYNQGLIFVGSNTTVSQGAHLCASTHDYNDPIHPLLLSPIHIDKNVWICTEAFIGPGVTVSEGVVVGARSVLMKSTESWVVYAGNPAAKIKERRKIEFIL